MTAESGEQSGDRNVGLFAAVSGSERLVSLHCEYHSSLLSVEQPVLSAGRLRRALPTEVLTTLIELLDVFHCRTSRDAESSFFVGL